MIYCLLPASAAFTGRGFRVTFRDSQVIPKEKDHEYAIHVEIYGHPVDLPNSVEKDPSWISKLTVSLADHPIIFFYSNFIGLMLYFSKKFVPAASRRTLPFLIQFRTRRSPLVVGNFIGELKRISMFSFFSVWNLKV